MGEKSRKKILGIFSFGKKEEENRAIVVVDFDNILINLGGGGGNFSLDSLRRGIAQLRDDIRQLIEGKVVGVYIFAPSYLISVWEKIFYELKFPVFACPKIEGRDTVDEIMMMVTENFVRNMDLTHLCVATGDAHFVPLYQEAHNLGLQTITIYASLNSLARELINVSDEIIEFPLVIK